MPFWLRSSDLSWVCYIKICVYVFFLFTFEACAEQCNISFPDIKGAIQSVNKADVLVISNSTDLESGEPICALYAGAVRRRGHDGRAETLF